MTGRLPFAPDFDHLIYVRVFEGCNLHCEHCFIPSNPKRMHIDQIARMPEDLARFAKPGARILVQWHGGEPTLFGAAWMREAIEALETAGAGYRFKHGIQTNLMSFDDDWAALYHDKFDGEVGVSWDPKIRLLRRDQPETHQAFDRKFWAQMERLQAHDLQPYLVMTATKTLFEHFRQPMEMFQMLVERGIRRAHLERVTETGFARDNWARVGLNNAAYSRGMARVLRAYVHWLGIAQEYGQTLHLSPFDGLLQSARRLRDGQSGGYGCWSGACDTRFHTFDSNGYKAGCTALTSEIDNVRAKTRPTEIPDFFKTREERQFHCGSCQFRRICSSGCLALNIEDGSGECSGGHGLFRTALDLVTDERTRQAAERTGDTVEVAA